MQADAGDLALPPWPQWLLHTVSSGGDGYCLHSTMQRRTDTASVLERVIRIGSENAQGDVRSADIVHFDLNPANVLHHDGHLTGIIDWSVPFDGAAQGDRGFDIATLLFYTYDDDASRDRLWTEAVAVSGQRWTTVYLAHLVLRQVEWTVRHRPGSAEEERFMNLAIRVLNDCEKIAG